MAMKKLSEEEWNEMFDRVYAEELHKFRHTEQKMFGDEDVAEELRYLVGDIVRNMYRVKMEYKRISERQGMLFTLTDRHGIQFYVGEYNDGILSIGVMWGRKRSSNNPNIVSCHSIRMADYYDKGGAIMHKLLCVIRNYRDIFKSTMDSQNAIDRLVGLVGTPECRLVNP